MRNEKKSGEIIIFTDKPALIKDKFSKKIKIQPFTALAKYLPVKGDKVFADVTGIEGVSIQKLLAQAKEAASSAGSAGSGAGFLNDNIKLPSSSTFPGWNKIKSGTNMPFYLLYCTIEGKTPIESRYGEKFALGVHKQFVELLEDNLDGCESLLWMNSGKDCLFLIPPKQKCIENTIKACLNMLISAPLNSMEYLDLPFPANFIFALHYGEISYKPPGKTGTIISDAINFIFHLGTKKAELGRLTVSGDLPGVSIPKELLDIFVPEKDFESRKIWQTRKFEYPKSWV